MPGRAPAGPGSAGVERPLGVAVVGSGRAGSARVRDLERCSGARLVRVVSARDSGKNGFEAALEDPEVQAVILCTPNRLHAPAARVALDRGKHVAVEFPLAPTGAEARALFDRARSLGRVLHVEHVELISASQRVQRGRAPGLGAPEGGALRFEADLEGWIGDPELAGSEVLRALARLHRLVDLFGSAEPASVSLERGGEGYRLDVELRFESGGHARLVEERRPGLARALEWSVRCAHGVLDHPGPVTSGPVFREDLETFVARVWTGSPSYVSEERVIEVLELVNAIEAQLGDGLSAP